MASWEVQLGNPLQMGLQWEYHYKWGIFKQAMFDRRVNIRKISQSLAPGGVSAKLLTLDGESLPAAQLKHLLSTVGAVGAVRTNGCCGWWQPLMVSHGCWFLTVVPGYHQS